MRELNPRFMAYGASDLTVCPICQIVTVDQRGF